MPRSSVLDEVPTVRLVSDPLPPGRGGCVSTICWCGIGEEDDKEQKGEVLRNVWWASGVNGISSSQLVRYTQHECCWVWLQVAGVYHCLTIWIQSVRCCMSISRDTLWHVTAQISWLLDTNRAFFEGTDVCWCLSHIIPGIIHDTDANNSVMLCI